MISKTQFFKRKKEVIRGRSISNANARFLSYDGVRGRGMNQDLILQGGHNENKIIVFLHKKNGERHFNFIHDFSYFSLQV